MDDLIVKGYLVTLRDGHECVLRNDKAHAELYAAQNHSTAEPMYVRRQKQYPMPPEAKPFP